MFRRTISILALAVALTPLATPPAEASARIQDAFHGAFAEGGWRTSPTSFGWTLVSRGLDGITRLSVHQYSDAVVNEDGDVTSGSVITGEAAAGVSFTIDTVHYTGASVSGSVPVSQCTIVNGAETNCHGAGTMSLSASWVGVGPIPHSPETGLWWDDCLYVDRSSSVERAATMEVELDLNGTSIPATNEGFTGFGKGNNRLIVSCTG